MRVSIFSIGFSDLPSGGPCTLNFFTLWSASDKSPHSVWARHNYNFWPFDRICNLYMIVLTTKRYSKSRAFPHCNYTWIVHVFLARFVTANNAYVPALRLVVCIFIIPCKCRATVWAVICSFDRSAMLFVRIFARQALSTHCQLLYFSPIFILQLVFPTNYGDFDRVLLKSYKTLNLD